MYLYQINNKLFVTNRVLAKVSDGYVHIQDDKSVSNYTSSLVFLFTHAMLFGDPGRPSATSPLTVALYWLLDLRLHRRLLCWT